MIDIIETLFNPNLTIESNRIKLRIVTPSDIDQLKTLAFESKIWKYFTTEINSERDLSEYIKNILNDFYNKKNVPFVIIDKKHDKIVGMSSFGNVSVLDSRVEIGWSWIGLDFQGTGVNSEYKRLLLSFAFDKLKFIRVEFKTDVLNVKARRALEKIGAVEEGVLRSHTQMHHNRRRDTIYYSILQEEWNH